MIALEAGQSPVDRRAAVVSHQPDRFWRGIYVPLGAVAAVPIGPI
jgi:hypothetical protein